MKRHGLLIAILAVVLTGCDQADKSVQAEDETNPYIRQALTSQREFDFLNALTLLLSIFRSSLKLYVRS